MTATPLHQRLLDPILRLLTELAAVVVLLIFLIAVLLESVWHRPWIILIALGLAWFFLR